MAAGADLCDVFGTALALVVCGAGVVLDTSNEIMVAVGIRSSGQSWVWQRFILLEVNYNHNILLRDKQATKIAKSGSSALFWTN